MKRNVVFTNIIKLTAEGEKDKLLLAAKRIRRATSTEFIISLVADDFSRASSTYVGKLRQVCAVTLTNIFVKLFISYVLDNLFKKQFFQVQLFGYQVHRI